MHIELLRSRFSGRCGLARLLAVTFLIRLGLTWSLPIEPLNPDYAEYRQLARQLRESRQFGFGTNWQQDPYLARSAWRFLYQESAATARPPGYPVLLAGAWGLMGDNLRLHQLLHVSAESINAVLLWQLAGGLGGSLAAWSAWGLWLTCPRGYLYSMQLIREPFIALCVLLWFAALVRAVREHHIGWAALAGVAAGMGAYFKETLILLALPSVAWLGWLVWRGLEQRRFAAACAAALVAAAAACPVPWIIRNSLLNGHYTGFSTLGWFNVQHGILARDWIESLPEDEQRRLDVSRAPDPVTADHIYRDRALSYIRAHPVDALLAMSGNALLFVSPASRDVVRGLTFDIKDLISISYTVGFYALVLVAAAVYWKRPQSRLILLAFAVMWASHAAFVGSPRFRYPFDALLTIMAGAGLAVLATPRKRLAWRPLRWTGAGLGRLRRKLLVRPVPRPAPSA